MAIADDFSIDYVNKRIYHSAGTAVYTVNQLYTYLMDTFDEVTQMDDEVPMSAQTPTEYTMINGWFIDQASTHYLKQGAIKTVGYTGVIQELELTAGHTLDATDIGKQLKDDAVEVGVILAVEGNEIYFRSASTVAASSAITVTGSAHTGTAAAASISGEDLYANIYTLGTIADNPSPAIYVQQGENYEGNVLTSWWARGHIDVLIKVKSSGVTFNDGYVRVFARQSGDSYDYFQINLNAGGRNAVPLATATDLNQLADDYYLMYDAESAPFTTGLIVTGGTSGATAEITSINDWGTEGLLGLRNIIGTFQDNETITDTSTGSATVNGTRGSGYLEYASETSPFTVGATLSGSTAGTVGVITALQDDGTTGKILVYASGATPTVVDAETITDDNGTPGSATSSGTSLTATCGIPNVKVWFMNHRLDYDGGTGDFVPGELVTGATSGATGTVIILAPGATTAAGNMYLANRNNIWFQDNEVLTGSISGAAVANGTGYPSSKITRAFEQQSEQSYKVVIDCGTNTLDDVYRYLKYICRENSSHAMYRIEDTAFTHVFQDDGGVFTDYTAAMGDLGVVTGDVYPLPAAPAVNDAFYLGNTTKTFGRAEIYMRTAGVGTWTITWEYWNGSTWTALTATDNTVGFTSGSGGASKDVYWTMPLDWATTAVNSVTGYWVRGRVSAFTSITTQPVADRGHSYANQQICYGNVYSDAHYTYTPVKSAPFGTFAGGKMFSARGIWIQNMATTDIQNYQLIDAGGVTQTPPNYQNVTVSNLVSGDRVSVFRTTGANNIVDKAMYTSHATNNSASTTAFEVTTAISVDTPSTGFLRIRNGTTGAEERIAYTSWTGSIFTLGSAHAGGYGSSDTAYVPFIDEAVTATSKSVSVIYTANRNVVVRVRRYQATAILPFETTGTFGSSGYSVSAIRTEDTIVGVA